MTRSLFCLVVLIAAALSVHADDLRESERFLCTTNEATACFEGAECVKSFPFELNIPQFVAVDLAKKTLSTTEASFESRVTPIRHFDRAEGLLVLQGLEEGRAFSMVIDEVTGFLSATVTTDGMGVTLFGACTPLPIKTAGD